MRHAQLKFPSLNGDRKRELWQGKKTCHIRLCLFVCRAQTAQLLETAVTVNVLRSSVQCHVLAPIDVILNAPITEQLPSWVL